MSDADRRRWDARYADLPPVAADQPPKAFVVAFADRLPVRGRALDLACGDGRLAVWLARRGLDVVAVDISAPALARLAQRARAAGVEGRVTAIAWDLDAGLPALEGHFDLVCCVDFHAPSVVAEARGRLARGGLLLLQVLLAVPGRESPFRVPPGQARRLAAGLEMLHYDEGTDADRPVARLLARRASSPGPSK